MCGIDRSVAAAGDDDPRWDLYDACVRLAERSWQGSSTTGTTLSHAAVQDYLRAAHATATAAGAVDLNLLFLNDRPVAFAYNYHYLGWVYGVRSGFDSSAAQDGAGNVLMGKMIEDSFRPRRPTDRPGPELPGMQTPLAHPSAAGLPLHALPSRRSAGAGTAIKTHREALARIAENDCGREPGCGGTRFD